jgi:MFS family permease
MSQTRILIALLITTFTDSLAEEFLQPLIVLRLEDAGTVNSLIGLATSSGDLGVLLAAPIVPWLIRVLTPVTYLRLSLSLMCGGVFLFPLFPNVYAWILLDFVFGAVTCGYFILSDSLINIASTNALRGRLIAIYMVAESSGAIGGPLLLGAVGLDGVAPFAIAAAIMAVGIAPWFLLGAVRPPALGRDPTGVSWLTLIRTSPLIFVIAAAAAYLGDVPAILLPVFAVDAGLATTTAVWMLSALAAGSVLLQFPAGWCADVLDRRRFLMLLSLLTMGLSVALLATVDHAELLWPTLFLLGGTFNAFDLVALALLGERASLGNLATLTAAATMFSSVASFVGPPVTGALMDIGGGGVLPLAIAAVALGVGLVASLDGWREARGSS